MSQNNSNQVHAELTQEGANKSHPEHLGAILQIARVIGRANGACNKAASDHGGSRAERQLGTRMRRVKELDEAVVLQHDSGRNNNGGDEQRHEHGGEAGNPSNAGNNQKRDAQTGDNRPNGEIQHASDGEHALGEHGVLNAEPADHRNSNNAAQNSGAIFAKAAPARQQARREAFASSCGAECPADDLQNNRAEHGGPECAPERHAIAERCTQNQLGDAANGANTNHQNLPERLLGSLRNARQRVVVVDSFVRHGDQPPSFFTVVLRIRPTVFETNVAHRRCG